MHFRLGFRKTLDLIIFYTVHSTYARARRRARFFDKGQASPYRPSICFLFIFVSSSWRHGSTNFTKLANSLLCKSNINYKLFAFLNVESNRVLPLKTFDRISQVSFFASVDAYSNSVRLFDESFNLCTCFLLI